MLSQVAVSSNATTSLLVMGGDLAYVLRRWKGRSEMEGGFSRENFVAGCHGSIFSCRVWGERNCFNEKLVNTGAGEAWAEPEVKEIGGEKGG